MKLIRRLRCHGSTICCQYVDKPMCNSPKDPHRRGRRAFWQRQESHRMTEPTEPEDVAA